jgi:hypothetical protein
VTFGAVSLASFFPTFRRNLMPLHSGVEGSKANEGITFVCIRLERLAQRHRVPFQGDLNLPFPLPVCSDKHKVRNILTLYSVG